MDYNGRERRIHKVFVTRNTEYHVRRALCVAVRDRRSGSWVKRHEALKQNVCGGLRFHNNGGVSPNEGSPTVGESIYFHADGRDIVTSAVLDIQRPPKALTATYP